MDKLNTALIGIGSHGRIHLSMIKDVEEIHLAAICDVDEEKLQKAKAEFGAERIFTDYRQMIDECDLDVVYVTTQPEPTAEVSIYCLEHGLNTSVEKPPGLTSEDTRRILEAENRSDGMAMVSLNRRYIPEVLAVRKMVHDRGGAVHCAATYNKSLTRYPSNWGKSLLICDSIHHVDLLRWFAGDAVEVYSESYLGDSPDKQRHNAVIRFASGCRGVIMSHYTVGYRIQRADVHGENFSAYLDLTSTPKCELYENGKPYNKPLDIDAVGGKNFNEVRHFVQCIKENKRPWSTLEDAVKTMELCEAIINGVKGAL